MRGAKRASSSVRRRDRSVHQFVRAQPRTASYHASGKEALRVGLSLLDGADGDEVLVPSYAPVGVVDAVLAAGRSPRFYPVESAHEPDIEAVETAVSEETMAVVAVQYFGHPQTRMRELRRLTRERGVALVDDASHGPLSSADGRALGAFGDVGFASFHKPLRVPDGAVLYVDETSAAVGDARTEPERSRRAGVASSGPRAADLRYYAALAGAELCDRAPALRTPLRVLDGALDRVVPARDTGVDAGSDAGEGKSGEENPDAADPRARTGGRETGADAAWRGGMSWATRRELRRIDPDDVRRERRETYRAWESAVADLPGVDPVFDRLPPGACPWTFPVRVDGGAERVLDRLDGLGGAFAWPRLPEAVAGAAEFPTANRLARSVVCLPLGRAPDEDRLHRLLGTAVA